MLYFVLDGKKALQDNDIGRAQDRLILARVLFKVALILIAISVVIVIISMIICFLSFGTIFSVAMLTQI